MTRVGGGRGEAVEREGVGGGGGERGEAGGKEEKKEGGERGRERGERGIGGEEAWSMESQSEGLPEPCNTLLGPGDAVNPSEVSTQKAKFMGLWESQSGGPGLIWGSRKDAQKEEMFGLMSEGVMCEIHSGFLIPALGTFPLTFLVTQAQAKGFIFG